MPTTTVTLTDAQVTLVNTLAREYFQHNSDQPNVLPFPTPEGMAQLWQQSAVLAARGPRYYIDQIITLCRTNRVARHQRDQRVVLRNAATDLQATLTTALAAVDAAADVVPEGHYAIETPEQGDVQPLRFYRVRAVRQRYGNRTPSTTTFYVYRMESDNARYLGTYVNNDANRTHSRVRTIVAAIQAAGIQQAAQRYGVEIGRCCVCNRALTDETSRSLGIGPDCRGARGRHAYWAGRDYSSIARTSTAPRSTEPQQCHDCGDVAIGADAHATAWCDECAIDRNVRLITTFHRTARRRTAAVA